MDASVQIDPKKIPDADYDTGCLILCGAVRAFLSDPARRREYEEWMRTPEGMAADGPGVGRGQSVKVLPADRTPLAAC